MPQLLKDNRVIDDTWSPLDTESQLLPDGDILYPLVSGRLSQSR